MSDLESLVAGLSGPNNTKAYVCLCELQEKSIYTDEVYAYFDRFLAMLKSPNSFIRNRGIALISSNLKWDEAGKLDAEMDSYLEHVHDSSAVTVRGCIATLPEIAMHKPQWNAKLIQVLQSLDTQTYSESMRTLIEHDRTKAIAAIEAMQA